MSNKKNHATELTEEEAIKKLQQKKAAHAKHNNEQMENRAVLDFYNEYNKFFLITVYRVNGDNKLSLELPECYDCDCSYNYSFRDLHRISISLGVYDLLESEIRTTQKYLSSHKMEAGTLDEFLYEETCMKSLTFFPFDYGIIRILEYFYLRTLIFYYKDWVDILKVINKNAQEQLNIDISKEVNQLITIEQEKDIENQLKLLTLENNKIFHLLKALCKDDEKLENIFVHDRAAIKSVVGLLATGLRVTIHLYYKSDGKIPEQGRMETYNTEFIEDSKIPDKEIFPNLDDEELPFQIISSPFNKTLNAIKFMPKYHPQICRHLKEDRSGNSPNFTKEDSMLVFKSCELCKMLMNKRQFVGMFRNICMSCLMLVGLKKNRVELQCGHKYCIDCFKELDVVYEDETFCLACSFSRTLYALNQ